MNAIERNIRKQTVNYIRVLKRVRTDTCVAVCKQMFTTYGHLLTNSQYEECFDILYDKHNRKGVKK